MKYTPINSQRGMIAIAAAVILPVLLLFIGLALTYSQALIKQTQLGNASEAAAMFLAIRDADDQQRNLPAAEALIKEFSSLQTINSSDLKLSVANNEHRVKIKQLSPAFTEHKLGQQLLVSNQGAASANSKANGQYDISIVLDLSSSVNSNVPQMRREIFNVIDELQTQFGDGNIRISLVPFSFLPSVYRADWLPESNTNIQCVDGHSYPTAASTFSDDIATANEVFLPPEQLTVVKHSTRNDNPWLAEGCPEIGTIALTEELDKVKRELDKFTESKTTTTAYSHAVIFGARMLAKSWISKWDSGVDYRPDSNKAMFIIGDGADTGSHAFAFRDQINAGLCNNIRAEGIEIYGLRSGRYRVGSYMETCIADSGKMADIADFTTFINQIVKNSGAANGNSNAGAQNKIKLIP